MHIMSFVCSVTTVLSAIISYVIWDNATGVGHLFVIFLFMAAVQAVYWLINFSVLYWMDKKEYDTPPTLQATKKEA